MSLSRNRIQLYKILMYLLVIPLIMPDGISHVFPILYRIVWIYGRYLSMICVFLLTLYSSINGKRKITDISFALFILSIIVFTVINNGSLSAYFLNYGNAFFLFLLSVYFKNKLPELAHSLLMYLEALIFINFFLVILYPNGMYKSDATNYTLNWLLGYKSSFQYYFLPAIAISWLEAEYTGKKINYMVLLLVCIVQAYMSGNMMLLIAELGILLVSVFHLIEFTKVLNGISYYVTIMVANVVVLFYFNIVAHSKAGQAFLNMIGKSGTLSGRVDTIWPRALRAILARPILGYGVMPSDANVKLLGMKAAIHSHNQLIEFMLTGGIILLAEFTIWLFLLMKRMKIYQNLKTTKIISFCVFVIMMMVIVEVFTRGIGAAVWFIFILAGHSEQLHFQYLAKSKLMKKKYKIKFMKNH